MDSPEKAKQFEQILAAEHESAQKLDKILDKEKRILTNGDPAQILAIADDKQKQMQETLRYLTERNQFLQRQGLPPGKAGCQQFIERLSPDSRAAHLWQSIEQLAVTLRDKNEINGGIVSLAERHTRQALDILSGKLYSSDTYGPEGDRQSGPSTPPIAKA